MTSAHLRKDDGYKGIGRLTMSSVGRVCSCWCLQQALDLLVFQIAQLEHRPLTAWQGFKAAQAPCQGFSSNISPMDPGLDIPKVHAACSFLSH